MAKLKYPFSPEILDAMPEELAELYRDLETDILKEITDRLKIADNLNEVTVQDIRALRSHGIKLEEIEKAIQDATGISRKKLNQLIDGVIERNAAYYGEVATLAEIAVPETIVSAAEIAAIRRQTWSAMQNITGSMGFLVADSGRLELLPPAKAYWHALDMAELKVQSGAYSYTQAIQAATKELANSGLKIVEYESGHVDHVDVAVRRAVMTGVNQVCDKYTQKSAEFLGTRYYEVSAHSGARDKPGKNPWAAHVIWQGKVYYESENGEPDPLGKYPDLYKSTGFGEVDGLEGANCRHHRHAFVPDVMERTYTDKQLDHIDDHLGCTFEGKEYTAYEATQRQREIERTVRKWERRAAAAVTGEDEIEAKTRIQTLKRTYREFSKAAGLPEQKDRMRVLHK